jgi:branched-chain amino acid transport system permease protein
MSRSAAELEEPPASGLRRLWRAGPYAWNQALTRPYVLIPFFVLAATFPLVTQYIEDNTAWTGSLFLTRIALQCVEFACLAMALNLVVGYAGLLNLGFIAFFGVGSYTYALVASAQLNQHFPLWSAVLAVIVTMIVFSLVVGIPSLRLRGDYLAIVTLAFGLVMRELTLDLDRPPVLAGHQFGPDGLNITGGTEGIHQVDPLALPNNFPIFHGAALQSKTYYWIFLGVLALYVFLMLRWRRTRVGRAWVAIREDELAARAMGVNTFKYRLLAFSGSAVMAGLVGMIDAANLHNAYPGNYDIQQTVLVFIMVILGGLASLPGAIIGAVIVTIIPYALQQLVNYKFVIFSVLLIILMIFRPEGLLGTVSIRPRQFLGGTVELFTSEPEAAEQAGVPSLGESAAELESTTGAIVDPPTEKGP